MASSITRGLTAVGSPKRTCKPACKPGPVLSRSPATVISLAGRLPGRSSDLPGSRNGPEPALLPYLVLLPVGFAEPACHQAAGGLLPRHFTLTRAPDSDALAVYFLLHFPY